MYQQLDDEEANFPQEQMQIQAGLLTCTYLFSCHRHALPDSCHMTDDAMLHHGLMT